MFWRNKIKEIEHAIDETIDTANNAHERIGKYSVEINYLKKTTDGIRNALKELEENCKNKWESTTKRVETCEKANEMFIKALNEQRDVIVKIIKFLNNYSKTKTTEKSKKGAK